MWDEKIEELEARREKAYNGGGQARIDKQHEKGKLTACLKRRYRETVL